MPMMQVCGVSNSSIAHLLFAVPLWAVVLIGIVALLLLLCCCYCICKKCICKKRKKGKDAKKGLKGAVDLKSVQLLGNSYKEKVTNLHPAPHLFLCWSQTIHALPHPCCILLPVAVIDTGTAGPWGAWGQHGGQWGCREHQVWGQTGQAAVLTGLWLPEGRGTVCSWWNRWPHWLRCCSAFVEVWLSYVCILDSLVCCSYRWV